MVVVKLWGLSKPDEAANISFVDAAEPFGAVSPEMNLPFRCHAILTSRDGRRMLVAGKTS